MKLSGTSRPADEAILKDLELQGTNHSFDEMICVEQKYDALMQKDYVLPLRVIWWRQPKRKVKKKK